MNNPLLILQTLDRHLDHQIELTLYGRAALALGFPAHEAKHESTQDVDAIIPLARLDELRADENFWTARDATNAELDAAYEQAVAEAIRAQFPTCPLEEAGRIAAWTCVKHSGRIGRSAAAKDLDPQALRLAVLAHVRHEHTHYDELLMRHHDRDQARAAVRPDIDRVLARWHGEPPAS